MAWLFLIGGILLGFKVGSFSVDVYSVYIPAALCVVPWLLVRYVFRTNHTRTLPYKSNCWLLVASGVGWVVAVFAPNIPLGVSSDSITTHLVGGAFVAPMLFLYCMSVYQVDMRPWPWWLRFFALFAFSCTFATFNELAEFALNTTGAMQIEHADTWIDLAANCTGTLCAYAAIEATAQRHSTRTS